MSEPYWVNVYEQGVGAQWFDRALCEGFPRQDWVLSPTGPVLHPRGARIGVVKVALKPTRKP